MRLRFVGYCDSAYQESPHRPDELTGDAIPKGAPLVRLSQDDDGIRVLFRRSDGTVSRDLVYPKEVAPWAASAVASILFPAAP